MSYFELQETSAPLCPLSQEVYSYPIKIPSCGHTFDYLSLKAYFNFYQDLLRSRKLGCPLCNQVLLIKDLTKYPIDSSITNINIKENYRQKPPSWQVECLLLRYHLHPETIPPHLDGIFKAQKEVMTNYFVSFLTQKN